MSTPATGKWNSQTFFQGLSEDTILTTNRAEKRGPHDYEVETTELIMKDNPAAGRGEIPCRGDYTVARTTADLEELRKVARDIGFSDSELERLEAVGQFQKLVGGAKDLKIEVRTNDDQFVDKTKRKTGASVVVNGPGGQRLVLSRDHLKPGHGGARVEWKDSEGHLRSHDSLLVDGLALEECQATRVDAGQGLAAPKTVDSDPAQTSRELIKHGEFALKVSEKTFRTTDRISKRIGPSVELLTAGLATISALHDFSKGETARGIRSLGSAAADFGAMVRALEDLNKGGVALGFSPGGAVLVKGMGIAGASIGFVAGAAKLSEGDIYGGSLDMASSGCTVAGLCGATCLTFVGGTLALASMAYDYHGDTVIATPRLVR